MPVKTQAVVLPLALPVPVPLAVSLPLTLLVGRAWAALPCLFLLSVQVPFTASGKFSNLK